MIGVLDLLSLCGYPQDARAKLVRHEDKRYPPAELLRHDWLEAYQSFQARPVFDGLDYIVSFVGGMSRALLKIVIAAAAG
jgi:hypothetical protein